MNIVEMVRYPERVYPVGRLDKDSEGLIFLTNQGDLVNRIMRGANDHEKEYVVQVGKTVIKEFARKMEAGVWLEDLNVTTKPCKVQITGRQEFHITLTQGLNRQIRRMCEALGYDVRSLRRIRIMNVHLGNLKTGTFRKVTAQEYKVLTEMLETGRG
jgi:23S rRNA pseudouridine2604 synthase